MGVALDTSALVDLERRGRALLGELPSFTGDQVVLPAIVAAELMVGVELASRKRTRADRLRKVQALLDAVQLLPFTAEIAPTYARLYVGLRRSGTPIPQNDLAIAATCVHHGHSLLVGRNDEAHFRLVPGLDLLVLGA